MYTLEEQNYIDTKVHNQGKNPLIAWLLWFFLSGIGGHRFYLGKTGSGIMMAITTFFISPFLLFLPSAIWVIVDALLLNGMIEQENSIVRDKAQREVLLMRENK